MLNSLYRSLKSERISAREDFELTNEIEKEGKLSVLLIYVCVEIFILRFV